MTAQNKAALTRAVRSQKRLRDHDAKTEALVAERDQAVLAALDAGHSMRAVAQALGLHTSRVGQLAVRLRAASQTATTPTLKEEREE